MRRHAPKHSGEEVPLSGLLLDFRSAIQSEIIAAGKNAAASGVPLANGRRIAQVGAAYQYVFEIENALHLPSDMPGDLVIKDGVRLEVTIISIDGLTITLSAPQDLGAEVPSASLSSDLTFLLRKLITRIEALADKSNPVGDRMLGLSAVTGAPEPLKLDDENLNPEQRAAVESSVGRDMTFVWGPPGTGKTRTIGAMCEQLYERNRPVLLVSHTNAAVDQALLRIRDRLPADALEAGHVIRVGEAKDPRVRETPLLLDETHKERRAAELTAQRASLVAEKDKLSARAIELSRQAAILEWLPEAQGDVARVAGELSAVRENEAQYEAALARQRSMEASAEGWLATAKAAEKAVALTQEANQIDEKLQTMGIQAVGIQESIQSTQNTLGKAGNLLATAEGLVPLRSQAKSLPGLQEINRRLKSAEVRLAQLQEETRQTDRELAQAQDLYLKASTVTILTRKWRGLPDPEQQLEILNTLRTRRDECDQQSASATSEHAEARMLHNKVAALAIKLAPYELIPDAEQQRQIVHELEVSLKALRTRLASLTDSMENLEGLRQEVESGLAAFRSTHGGEPSAILVHMGGLLKELAEARRNSEVLLQASGERRSEVEEKLAGMLAAVVSWGLVADCERAAETMLATVNGAYEKAADAVKGLVLNDVRSEQTAANGRIEDLQTLIAGIDEELKAVEDAVIAEARIVATTLTRAYLRDSIQKRRFDTVILDEASMAPIPALWVAASLADTGAVVVGDPKQLPPIVMSKDESALKWLGTDIFDMANVQESSTDHLVALRWQHRMHAKIAAIPNTLVYGGKLRNGEREPNPEFEKWYNKAWLFDRPVLLVDTEPLAAWVTSVRRGKTTSRLNFLSATICVDIAAQLLRDERAQLELGAQRRILVVSPYRPHASLLTLLLKERGLANDAVAGTAHSFQGSEADVVILDLVNDEPHWRVGMFIRQFDKMILRLLNVALTRAKERLIIVGDFNYIAKRAKKAFLGKKLIPFLKKHYPCVDAREIVPAGLSARAARAQYAATGGAVEPTAKRMVVKQDRFYPLLAHDLAQAQGRVVVFSAFLTETRLAALEPQLKAAVERGVAVYVVTKTLDERNRHEAPQYRKLERTLGAWGVRLVHKRGMHEKLVFIDDRILWSGSLNPLSFRNTQEVMERRDSDEVVTDYLKTLRVADLVGEYQAGTPQCPICGEEVVATEGSREPFYWRCVQDGCFRRKIDGPRYAGGVVRCANCGGEVEFGEWGERYVWRCVENKRHRQDIARTHLRLPEMRNKIPKRVLTRLAKELGMPTVQARSHSETEQQTLLFDE